MSEISDVIEKLIKRHGGLRKASRAIGVNPPYLCRLKSGQQTNPSDKILKKLGIVRKITYRAVTE